MAPTKYNGTDAPLVESDGAGGFAPVVSVEAGGATDPGTKITAATMPAGGVGLIGWMSAAWYHLASLVGIAGTPSADVLSVQGVTNGVPVAVSNASLPLPTGAATGAKQDTGNTSLGTIATNTTNAGAPVLAAGENHVGEVGGRSTIVAATLTRPNDTTTYTANDAVTDSTSAPAAIDFAGMVRSAGKSGLLTTWQMTRNSTVAATFRLWLYQDTITPANDNAAFSIAAAATDKRVGYVDFTTSIAGSDCLDYYGTPVFTNWPVKPVSGTGLKGVLQALTGFIPIANETFKFKVGSLMD
jgi:hypothetical protein